MACRLCTANDHEALREKLAEDLWESRRSGHLDDVPWSQASGFWRANMLDFADAAIASLKGPDR